MINLLLCFSVVKQKMNDFSEMFETNNPYKWVCLVYSIILFITLTPLLYLVIMFQNENPYTTLLQQFLSSILLVAILMNIFGHIPFTLLYIIGPFSQQTCNLLLVSYTSFGVQLLLHTNFLILTRYIFTCILRNPAAVHHDFWRLFIFIWTFLVAFLSQITLFLLPGNNPNMYYVCSGKIPMNYNSLNKKYDYPFFTIICLTLCCHAFLEIKIKLYLRNKNFQNNVTILTQAKISESYDILNITYQIIIAACYFAILMPLIKTLSMNLISFQEFPKYLLMYWYYMGSMQSFELITLTILFVKNSQLVKFVKRSVQEAYSFA